MIETSNTVIAFLGNIGPTEIVIILVAALLIFGNRLPEVGRSLGKGIIEFKKGVKGIEDDIEDEVDRAEQKATIDTTAETVRDENEASPVESPERSD